MAYVNQIHLMDKGVEANKKFFRALYDCQELVDPEKWFNKLIYDDSTIAPERKRDDDMTLDKFLEGINPEILDVSQIHGILQIASPNILVIRYSLSFVDLEDITRTGWIACPYNGYNLSVVEKIYNETFNCDLMKEPAPKGLEKYYRWLSEEMDD